MKIVKRILKGIGILCLLFVILCVVAVACSSDEETSTTTAAATVKETTTEAEDTTEADTEAPTEEPTAEEETEEAVEVVATTETNEVEEVTSTDNSSYDEALRVHGISLDTIKKIVALYEYNNDSSCYEGYTDNDWLRDFEAAIEEWNYKITEDGWGMVSLEDEQEIEELRYFISNPNNGNTILTTEEARALSDDDVIGIYGMMYNYELYTQDDPGREDSNYWEVTKDNVVDVIRNAQKGDYIYISNGIVSLPINRGNNIIIYPSDGLSYDPSNCFRLVVTNLDMRFSNGDHLEIYGTFDYQDDIAWIIPESVSYLN